MIMTDKVPEKWKWLFQPLARTSRARLEICLGVVLTFAAIVGLSTVIRPDPSKLASSLSIPLSSSAAERRYEADLRVVPHVEPKVSPEFAMAVARGDLDALKKQYTKHMALEGMLAVAAETGRTDVVAWLLEIGADVHEDEDSVDAPVLLADDHPAVVALLRGHGAAEPKLATAAQASAPNAVSDLLAAHAPVNVGTFGDASPLNAAVSTARGTAENKKAIVEKLLAAGADPNREDGEAPLTNAVSACDGSHWEHAPATDCQTIIKLLVKHGARTKGEAIVAALSLNDAEQDPIFDVLVNGHLEKGATAVALAAGFALPPRAVKALVAKGVDWSWHDGEDDAALPLLAAVQRGDRDFARALLDAGAPADVHYKDAKCALGEAIDASANDNTAQARIVELLIARGADVNRRLPDGRTPLFAAAESGDVRVVTALLDRGARPNDLVLDDTALDAAEQH
ncbi:MAG: Ankyrin, partial [Labilithrix sp.]|nr:Ankyrin [Labilithrix sp.]